MVKTYVLVEMAVRTDKAPGIPAKKKKKKIQGKIRYHQNHEYSYAHIFLVNFIQTIYRPSTAVKLNCLLHLRAMCTLSKAGFVQNIIPSSTYW